MCANVGTHNCRFQFPPLVFFFRLSSKVDQIQDIVTGNPTVIKMVVSFNRGARGHNTLRQLLAPVVKEIIDNKSLGINTNPVDVYKAWVNQLETVTGEARNSRRSIKMDSKGEEKGSKKWKPQSLKYTAARLHEKGVILEIEGLQTNQ
ncbi:hypothetical protein XENOCAPTIV_001686 [Xenoophorus captivus]|uniref:Ras-GAP domain-containing protein n=1 Tax=Xenoophorus captivus TaxID=1517983 RepID=A0ABV0REW2_9TELE